MTTIAETKTQLLKNKVISGELTFGEAVRMLKGNAHMRPVSEVLASAFGIPDASREALQSIVSSALCPTGVSESARKKVESWVDDKVQNLTKANAIELLFAISCSRPEMRNPEKAEPLLIRLCAEGFHWRDPEDLIFLYALQNGLSYSEALSLRSRMVEKGLVRSTGGIQSILAKLAGLPEANADELCQCLTDLLADGENEPKRDSIAKKVRGWLDDENVIGLNDAIELCFGLELTPAEADQLLLTLREENFLWGTPEGIIYAYALQNSLPFAQAKKLVKRLNQAGLLATDGKEHYRDLAPLSSDDVRRQVEQFTSTEHLEAFLRSSRNRLAGPNALTELIKSGFQSMPIVDEAGLEAFLTEEKASLGQFHNTAYEYFTGYLEHMGTPVATLLFDQLYKSFIPTASPKTGDDSVPSQAALSALQRCVKKYWPTQSDISRMRTRKKDVSRKALILLFLAADANGTYAAGSENKFLDAYARLEDMLGECGFAQLDPRIPFDWIVLFCLCRKGGEYVDSTMYVFLSQIFTETDAARQVMQKLKEQRARRS